MSRIDYRDVGMGLLAVWLSSAAHAYADFVPEQLQAALIERYPQVVRWEIAPTKGAAEFMAASEPTTVLRVGPRSAVSGHGKTYWYSVRGYATGLRAAKFIDAGQTLADAVEAAELDLVAAGCEPATGIDAAEWRARRRLPAGTSLCASAVEPVPAVERGARVKLQVRTAAIELSASGRAMEDGHSGERVKVRSGSGEVLEGIVTGKGEVRIHASL